MFRAELNIFPANADRIRHRRDLFPHNEGHIEDLLQIQSADLDKIP